MRDQAAEVVARWRQADERLYPIVLADPGRYTQIVSVVRNASDDLSSRATLDDLVAARRHGRAVVSRAAEAVGVPVERLGDLDLVADAAFHLRLRELTAQSRRRAVADAIAAARARGDAWVVVRESGSRDQPGVAPYERIDMRLADGWGVQCWADVDPDSYGPVYGLTEVLLDRHTGVVIDDGRSSATRTYTSRAKWEAAWTRCRASDDADS